MQLVLDPRREDSLQPGLCTSQVDRLAAVNGDEARLGPLRLANICDRDRVNIRAARILVFLKVHGELAGVQDRLGGRVAAALGAQDDVASRRSIEVEEEIPAPGQTHA